MNTALERLLTLVNKGSVRADRIPLKQEEFDALAARIADPALPLVRRASLRLRLLLEEETVCALPGQRIVGLRSIPAFPDLYASGEKEALCAGKYVHEQGRVCNLCPDYEAVLREGLLPRRARALQTLKKAKNADPDFIAASVESIDAVLAYADRWALLLRRTASPEACAALQSAIRTGAKTLWEALQVLRLLHLCLWASNVYHNTLGRFDQYLYPYYLADLTARRETKTSALELIEEFFLSCNLDSDLYQGMQQGDNGQSLMLGGCDAKGQTVCNDLTELCLQASLELNCIDPKINLRVDKNTPPHLYRLATLLTKQGLGFPQYSNDDIVIPGLVKLGYKIEDARNYTVAACWEFIIPGLGADIPNIAAMPLASVVDQAIRKHLADAESFEMLLALTADALKAKADELIAPLTPLFMEPAPWLSVLMTNPLRDGRDICEGSDYDNYGIHGTGFAVAVDQLAAVKAFVYDEARITRETLLADLENGFATDKDLFYALRNEAPKLGRDEAAQPIADALLTAFSAALAGRVNERGGCFRAGTGSAMYYLWHAEELGALCNGHLPGEPLPANFSPALGIADMGPLSVIRAFARPAVKDAVNGGPLTLELHDTVFRNEEGVQKVAALVETFIKLGGHQLQLNAVNRQTLLDAQQHPEKHRDLIVRVWGWSGKFVQLDKAYQDQIIARTSYTM